MAICCFSFFIRSGITMLCFQAISNLDTKKERKKEYSQMAPQLPKAFGLQLPSNSKYLALVTEDNEAKNLLKFYADDINDSTAVFEWEPAKSGGAALVHLKCASNSKYWQRQKPWRRLWIAGEGDKPVEDTGSLDCTLFEVIIPLGSDGSKIQLKHVQTGFYIVAWPTEDDLNLCLYAEVAPKGDDIFSVVEVGVPVSTEISDVKFRLAEAKINKPTTADLVGAIHVNNDHDSNQTTSAALEYSVVKSSAWKLASSSLTPDLITNINSAIPIIINNGKVELSGDEATGLYQDSGKPWETTVTEKTSYKVMIPPKSKATVTLKATHASADIPFSYTQRITYADGRVVTRDMDDGIFTRINHYDFKYEAKVTKNA